MGFFSDLKEDLSQAVNELMPEEDLNQGDVAETKEQPVKNMPETTEKVQTKTNRQTILNSHNAPKIRWSLI